MSHLGIAPELYLPLKSDSHLAKKIYIIYFSGKPFKKPFNFLSRLFGHDGNYKDQMNFKIHDVTTWSTNNYSTYIP